MTTTEIIKRAYKIASKYVEVEEVHFSEDHNFKTGQIEKRYQITVFYKPTKEKEFGNFSANQYPQDNAKRLEILFSRVKQMAQKNATKKLAEPFEIETDLF